MIITVRAHNETFRDRRAEREKVFIAEKERVRSLGVRVSYESNDINTRPAYKSGRLKREFV